MQEKFSTKQWIALAGISLITFTLFLDVTIVSNALPTIQKELFASNIQLQWIPNAIYISLCAFMAIMGRMGDLYGIRKIFYGTTCIFILASIGCGFSQSINQLIFFRIAQGICAASMSLSAALIGYNFNKLQLAKAMGIFSGLAGAGLALGPILGGSVVEYFGWRWIFFLMVPISTIGLALCIPSVTEKQTDTNKGKTDWIGASLLIITVVSVITTTTQADEWGWNSSSVWLGYLLFIISLTLFIIVENKVKNPIMPFHLLLNRTFIPCAMTCALCGLFIAVFLFFNPLYLQIILGLTPTTSGWLLFIISITYLIMTPIAGLITHRLGVKAGTIVVSFFLIFTAMFHGLFSTQENLWLILSGFICFGLAWGSVNVGPVVAVMHASSEKDAGIVVGSMWTIFNLGSGLGLALMGLFFHHVENHLLLEKFSQKSVALTPENLTVINEFISNPEAVKLSGSDFYLKFSDIFNSSFVEGFNNTSWILSSIALTTFLVVFFVMNKNA